MGLEYHLTKGKDPNNYNPGARGNIEVFMCSVKSRVGYSDGFQWLSSFLAWTINTNIIRINQVYLETKFVFLKRMTRINVEPSSKCKY
jgi:hypothetical protein